MKQKNIIIVGSVAIVAILVVIGIILLTKNYTPSGNSNNSGNSQLQVTMGTTQNVAITNYAFTPSQLIIKVGDTVTWTNNAQTGHTITSDSGSELASPTISSAGTYTHTFTKAGTYNYHCSIHPSMIGQVIVT